MWLRDIMCNCALFLSYISWYGMGVCLCLYRTTWTACRYFRIVFNNLLGFMYPLSSVVDTLELALKQSRTTDKITEGIPLLRTNIMCSLSFEILEIFRLTVSFLCRPPHSSGASHSLPKHTHKWATLKVWNMTDSINWRSLSDFIIKKYSVALNNWWKESAHKVKFEIT